MVSGCHFFPRVMLEEDCLLSTIYLMSINFFTLSSSPPHFLIQLRQLGLPTKLDRGIITLTKDFLVCKGGDQLKPEQARILKLLGHQMAEFKILLTAVWSNDGTFEILEEDGGKGGNDGSDVEND